MKKIHEAGYNERLFSEGFRKKWHLARFFWLKGQLIKYRCDSVSVLELGCFDAKTINYFSKPPIKYLGLDANWENGLELAKTKWKEFDNIQFEFCSKPEDITLNNEKFDIGICMETLEHLPNQSVDGYLREMSNRIDKYLFITIPNEIGLLFLLKYLGKTIFGVGKKHTIGEVIFQTLGKTDKVQREGHKGFNYHNMVDKISNYFEIIDISGHPFSRLPTSFNIGVGIVCKKK